MCVMGGSDRANDNQTHSKRGMVENIGRQEVPMNCGRMGSHVKEVTHLECEYGGSLEVNPSWDPRVLPTPPSWDGWPEKAS